MTKLSDKITAGKNSLAYWKELADLLNDDNKALRKRLALAEAVCEEHLDKTDWVGSSPCPCFAHQEWHSAKGDGDE